MSENITPNPYDYKTAKAVAKANRPAWRKKRYWAAGFVALVAMGSATGGGETTAPATATETAVASNGAVGGAAGGNDAKPTPAPAPEPVEPAEPAMTVAQEQAVTSAESYLDFGGFSRDGLIDQLTSEYGEGFARADAVFAVDHIAPDWNAEAVESARSYLDMGGMSRDGLIDQLTSAYGEQFTMAQAVHAVDTVGL